MAVIIKRKRYVVVNDKSEIFCGLAKHYVFKPIDNIGDTSIKTYHSANKAIASFVYSWRDAQRSDFEKGKYRVVEVIEGLTEVDKGV